ncbi:MAG: 1-deoxy-D-xylulose-5-phosphate synthase [Chloroflexi bacterium]|nr:MAG: 1-deoxy-D-xylulose-5-phosphate synthase [Chloroflexota bacterium]TME47704.1 MAG: 1-deoxy-D-xylulose-5-phosphate synthase [Chloroflexota bacterium]
MNQIPNTPLLDQIKTPADLRSLSDAQLHALGEEIRQFLVATVSKTGGHLGPNLGVVELTLALHRTFDSPRDRILWDTGHQAYVHKLLTRPRDGFTRLRKLGGMSGYPSRVESEHDFIENSHASTGLSYAAGMAEALQRQGRADHVVVVVGDGALTGGMAYEALNNIGHRKSPVIIVVNDNGRSYAPTIGGLAQHLAQQLTVLNPSYHRTKSRVDRVLRAVPAGEKAIEAGRRIKEGLKELVSPRTFFEYLGIKYSGPIDGHNVQDLERTLRQVSRLGGPVVVHVITSKGHGYGPAEEDEIDHLHGVGAFDVLTAQPISRKRTYTDVFGDALVEEAQTDPRIVAITAAMGSSAGLSPFAERFPDRFYDVGIAEQHAVTFSAGLAMAGMRPVVAIYSTFLQRALDQVMMDVCLHRLPVTFVLDRAGITGDDGPSHHGIFDLTFLRAMPGLTLAAASDPQELRDLLHTAVSRDNDGPFAIRFPKGAAPEVEMQPAQLLPIGEWQVRRQGSAGLLLATGKMVSVAMEAAALLEPEGIPLTVVNARYIKPLDPRLESWARRHPCVLTLEDNVMTGGFGSAVSEVLAPLAIPVTVLAVPDAFIGQGTQVELLKQLELDATGVAARIRRMLASPEALPAPPASQAASPA